MLLCDLFAACARKLVSIGEDGLLSTCFCPDCGGGESTSSMLRMVGVVGGTGLSTSSMLRTGAKCGQLVLVRGLTGEYGEGRGER